MHAQVIEEFKSFLPFFLLPFFLTPGCPGVKCRPQRDQKVHGRQAWIAENSS